MDNSEEGLDVDYSPGNPQYSSPPPSKKLIRLYRTILQNLNSNPAPLVLLRNFYDWKNTKIVPKLKKPLMLLSSGLEEYIFSLWEGIQQLSTESCTQNPSNSIKLLRTYKLMILPYITRNNSLQRHLPQSDNYFVALKQASTKLLDKLISDAYPGSLIDTLSGLLKNVLTTSSFDDKKTVVSTRHSSLYLLEKPSALYLNFILSLEQEEVYGTRGRVGMISKRMMELKHNFEATFGQTDGLSLYTRANHYVSLRVIKHMFQSVFEVSKFLDFFSVGSYLETYSESLKREMANIKPNFPSLSVKSPIQPSLWHHPASNEADRSEVPESIYLEPNIPIPPLDEFMEKSTILLEYWLLSPPEPHHCCSGHPLSHQLHSWLDGIYTAFEAKFEQILAPNFTKDDQQTWDSFKEILQIVSTVRTSYNEDNIRPLIDMELKIRIRRPTNHKCTKRPQTLWEEISNILTRRFLDCHNLDSKSPNSNLIREVANLMGIIIASPTNTNHCPSTQTFASPTNTNHCPSTQTYYE